ncbi:hypothetical protein FSP39_015252 [Pinctada imbricata]|uniref:Uncharacterized protein n=1 Tax=Pinctada imbricata TaxID=66713 RepID=A0AA88YPG9_PINIB|nr:hypothetical protein FSP39_015252 [Pinctada imbricata]
MDQYPLLAFFAVELTRYLTGPPFYRDIDVVNNPEFETSNRILNPIESRRQIPTSHTKMKNFDYPTCIKFDHLRQLYASDCLSGYDQFSLQNKVWMDVNLYFGGFTREHLRDMKKTSFLLENDPEEGRRYYRIVDPRLNASSSTRMYEQPGQTSCPVSTMERYLSFLNPDSDVFFQQPYSMDEIKSKRSWYSLTPIGKNIHSHRLSTICKQIGIYGQLRNTSMRHLSRQIHSRYPEFTPRYSDKLFGIVSGTEVDPLDGSYI